MSERVPKLERIRYVLNKWGNVLCGRVKRDPVGSPGYVPPGESFKTGLSETWSQPNISNVRFLYE